MATSLTKIERSACCAPCTKSSGSTLAAALLPQPCRHGFRKRPVRVVIFQSLPGTLQPTARTHTRITAFGHPGMGFKTKTFPCWARTAKPSPPKNYRAVRRHRVPRTGLDDVDQSAPQLAATEERAPHPLQPLSLSRQFLQIRIGQRFHDAAFRRLHLRFDCSNQHVEGKPHGHGGNHGGSQNALVN